ncbi:MAG: glycosyltransferase [Halioglobus sp.]
MSVLVDLQESRIWLEADAALPAWLDAAWLASEDARLLCRLNNPDDLTALRSIIPDPARLLAYPEYPALAKHLSDADAHLLHSTFCSLFHADRYMVLTPGQSEQRYSELQQYNTPARRAERSKPTLALVSPLPPAASGIANYCHEILPSLAQFYDITLVVERPSEMDAELAQEFDTIDHLQMMRIGRQFDRIMYHFGNSPFHYDYFGLLKAHPGVVVLHDIYLGDCLLSNCGKFGSSELLQAVYASHGWSAIVDCNGQVELAIRLYPACAAVFNDSYGVLVHSDHAADILSKYFGKEISSQVTQIPLARRQKVLPDRLAARQALGFTREEIVYSSFGLINPNKCLEEIMDAWVVSGLAEDQSARLCFVGGFVSADLQDKLQSWSKSLAYPKQVVVTGYVSSEIYDQYLSATDVAVQLRTNSRGESSAAALDCLGAGLTTVINAHGSMAEIPGDIIIKLPDEFSIQALSNALMSASEPGETKGQEARRHVQTQHSPEVVARAYSSAIESHYANSQNAILQRQHDLLIAPQVEHCSAPAIWTMCEELNDLMSCAGASLNSAAGPQLLVDVSAVVIHDLGTGIQRVVRNILRELLVSSRLGYRVEAVYYDFESECFRYARSFVNRFMGLPPLYLSDDPVEARPGDIFLGLDLYYAIAEREVSRGWLQAWRGRGVRICYVVYDLLPIVLPSCFPEDSVPHYESWLKAASGVSDAIVCISRAIADEYCAWFEQEAPGNGIRPHIG